MTQKLFITWDLWLSPPLHSDKRRFYIFVSFVMFLPQCFHVHFVFPVTMDGYIGLQWIYEIVFTKNWFYFSLWLSLLFTRCKRATGTTGRKRSSWTLGPKRSTWTTGSKRSIWIRSTGSKEEKLDHRALLYKANKGLFPWRRCPEFGLNSPRPGSGLTLILGIFSKYGLSTSAQHRQILGHSYHFVGLITNCINSFDNVMFSVVSICIFTGWVPHMQVPLRMCWNLPNLNLTVLQEPFTVIFKLVCYVGKQAVGILLYCLLMVTYALKLVSCLSLAIEWTGLL